MTTTRSTPMTNADAPSRLRRLTETGQSVWIDWLTRDLLAAGGLEHLIEEHAVGGVTTNPTILEHALSGTRAYEREVSDLLAFDLKPVEIATELAAADVTDAAVQLLPLWEASGGIDGYISWEVDPGLASDPAGTMAAVRTLARRVELPNLLVKIPATEPGLGAVEDAIAEGYSINVTLIFSLERYAAVVESYLRGLRRAADAGLDLASIHSVASLFISRLDSAADAQLERERSPFTRSLRGRLGIASAKLAYRHYQACFSGARWNGLRAHGATPQRLLWASTSTKDPSYRDVRYVEELIGPETVTTLSNATLTAFEDHGRVAETLIRDVERAALVFDDLAIAGIDLKRLTDDLEREAVARFSRSQEALEECIASHRRAKAA